MVDNALPGHVVPVGPRAVASPDLIAAVRVHWDLGDITTIDDLGGTYNLNLHLATDRGPFVLRVYRPWVTPERLATVQAVRTSLEQRGLPVLPSRPTTNGALAIAVDRRLVELEPWRPDDGGTDSPERWMAAAGLLGRLHAALRLVEPAIPLAPALVHNALPPPIFDDWLGRTRMAVEAHPRTEQTAIASRACRDSGQIARAARDVRDVARSQLVRHLVHGDYGHGNVRFSGDEPCLLVDFDFLHVTDRIADLADLAFGPHWMDQFGQTSLRPEDRDWDAVAGLIRRYDGTNGQPLTADEIAALPLAIASVPLNWIAASWLQEDVVAAVNLVAPELETAAWLVRHHRELATHWRRGS